MTYTKEAKLTVILASIIAVGTVSSLLLSSTTHEAFAQVNSKAGQENTQKQSGMHTGSMNTNMTMDQMLDMMGMMHTIMMNMMRVMAHSGAMNGSSSMTGNSNMTTMGGM